MADIARISPTDISQFIRLEQCGRYLRLRLQEKSAGEKFIYEYGVTPQPLPPLLTMSGGEFEVEVEKAVSSYYRTINFAKEVGEKRDRDDDSSKVVELARELLPGNVVVLFQSRLRVEIAGWQINGDVDIIRLERDRHGRLSILIVDMKSSTSVKVEHRLQVAFYNVMVEKLFEEAAVIFSEINTAILYSGPADPDKLINRDNVVRHEAERDAAHKLLGVSDGLLEVISEQQAYLDSVYDLVTGPVSTARRLATIPFEDVPYHLSYKCDGCLYNEFCMKWSAEKDDLSLLPHMTTNDKIALKRAGVSTVRELALLKDLRRQVNSEGEQVIELVPVAGKEDLAKGLAATWPVGPRVDELIHRARRYRAWKKDPIEALTYIPTKGYGSLPFCDANHNPNLIRIYIDAQHDFLQDRICMLGSLVVASEGGVERAERRRHIVHLTDGPPDHTEKERQLFVRWIGDTLKALVELAAPDEEGKKRAPVHVIFFNRYEQRLLLDGLSRHFSTVLGSTPLYDFMTQLAAFDSPIATFLDEEIRELKNYPMVCQSLQAVAAFLGFDWNRGEEKYRDIFKERLFDFWGKLEQEGTLKWYTNRSRFNSQIPLEFVYAAWDRLPKETEKRDPFAPYRAINIDLLRGFQQRRLEALECVAKDFKGNHLTEKQSFNLPELAAFTDKARTLAAALDEFLTIERHVELGEWKSIRHIAPERRALMGETLIVRYCEEDQEPGVAMRNRENERRRLLKEEYRAAYMASNPSAKQVRLPKEKKAESDWSQERMRFHLRLETTGLDCDLDEILMLSKIEEGNRLIIYPRMAWDERLPVAERKEFTPTPKQMLYGTRADLLRVVVERDSDGKAVSGYVEVELQKGFRKQRGYAFAAIEKPLIDGKIYTLDSDPNNFYGSWCAEVTEALCRTESGEQDGRNTLYERIANPLESWAKWPQEAIVGQKRFLAGLNALQMEGALHDFEPGKRDYIGTHGGDPILLVQGPPGTGKSYSTAFAIFARLQGAMAAGIKYHVFVSCKTHAATDVLLANILEVQKKLRELYRDHLEIFTQFIDPRLLEVPLFRMTPKEKAPQGVIELTKDENNVDLLSEHGWCIVAATPGGIRNLIKGKWTKSGDLLGHYFCNCLVLDEASQMNIPEAAMAALPLYPDGQLIVVGDHRQMPPIVHHDWESEPRRTFQEYKSYQSLFWMLQSLNPPIVKFEESFRLHTVMAEFLRREIYIKDGINYFSQKKKVLPRFDHQDEFVAAVLSPDYPITVIVHEEAESQTRNPYEQALVGPILSALADPGSYGLDAMEGIGVVVPHRMQRAAIQKAFPFLRMIDPSSGIESLSAVDTVERFQGDERRVILVSATESDREYLLVSNKFLLDPRRLTVAMSRAKQKMILVASRSIFSLFDADEETFTNLQMWKNLLRRTCTEKLWEGEQLGKNIEVWGNERGF
jgi:hypothetical protein